MPVSINKNGGFTVQGSLAEARKEAGLTQQELGDILGLDQPFVSNLEKKFSQYLRILALPHHKNETRRGPTDGLRRKGKL